MTRAAALRAACVSVIATAFFLLLLSLSGCALWPGCWGGTSYRPCYCSTTGNPCCERPRPPACKGKDVAP